MHEPNHARQQITEPTNQPTVTSPVTKLSSRPLNLPLPLPPPGRQHQPRRDPDRAGAARASAERKKQEMGEQTTAGRGSPNDAQARTPRMHAAQGMAVRAKE